MFIPSLNAQGRLIPVHVIGWTLNFEMVFYVLFALALALEIPPLWFLGPVLGLIASVGALGLLSAWPAANDLASPMILEFLFGVLLADCALRRKLPSHRIAILLLIGGFVAILTLAQTSLYHRAFTWGLPAAAIVTGVVALEDRLGRKLPTFLLELGNASYSIYLVHTFLVSIAWALLLRLGLRGGGSLPLMILLTLGLSILAGELVHRLIELPSLRILRGKRVRGVSTLPSDSTPQSHK